MNFHARAVALESITKRQRPFKVEYKAVTTDLDVVPLDECPVGFLIDRNLTPSEAICAKRVVGHSNYTCEVTNRK